MLGQFISEAISSIFISNFSYAFGMRGKLSLLMAFGVNSDSSSAFFTLTIFYSFSMRASLLSSKSSGSRLWWI
jgi:hypothetical protein